MISSKSRCRSKSASLWPENRIGPQPYWARRSGAASDLGDTAEVTSFSSCIVCSPSCRRPDRLTCLPLRCDFHVTIIVPQPDRRLGQVVLVTQRAKARGTQHEVPAGRRFEAEPAGSEHPQEMTARKQ